MPICQMRPQPEAHHPVDGRRWSDYVSVFIAFLRGSAEGKGPMAWGGP